MLRRYLSVFALASLAACARDPNADIHLEDDGKSITCYGGDHYAMAVREPVLTDSLPPTAFIGTFRRPLSVASQARHLWVTSTAEAGSDYIKEIKVFFPDENGVQTIPGDSVSARSGVYAFKSAVIGFCRSGLEREQEEKELEERRKEQEREEIKTDPEGLPLQYAAITPSAAP